MTRVKRLGSLLFAVGAIAGTWEFLGRHGVVERATISAGRQSAVESNLAQVTGVSAVHREGQTFITWKEVTPPPPAEVSLADLRTLQRELAEVRKLRYAVYRSNRPITSPATATLIAEVDPLSGWNAGHYGGEARPNDRPRWFVIEDGGSEIVSGTGLFVHHPSEAGPAYYAVTVRGGTAENQRVTETNSSARVDEAPGEAPPVLQRIERPTSFNYVEKSTLHFYVRWERLGNTSRSGRPYDYLVGYPDGVTYPAPVGVHLHAWSASMRSGYGWWFNASKGAILVASNQEPYDWWTGYHESYYDGRPPQASEWAKGVVRPYTERRVLSFVDWLATHIKIDRSRMFMAGVSMGGSGALMTAIRHPELVAWALSWVGVHDPRESPQFRSSYELVWGKPEWNVKFENGTPVWDYYSDPSYLRRFPERDIPFLTFSNGKNDGAIGWPQAVNFARALQETRQPHLFAWGQEGHGQRARMPDGGRETTMPLDLRIDRSLPAFTRSSLDDDLGNGDPASGSRTGQLNAHLTWSTDSIVDQPSQWAIMLRLVPGAPQPAATADVTPRRLQQFKPRPGDIVAWSNEVSGRVIQTGDVETDRWGLVTVPQVEIRAAGSRLTLKLRGDVR